MPMEKKKRMKNHGDSVCYIMVLSCPLVAYPFREATIQVFIGKSFFHITSRRIIDLVGLLCIDGKLESAKINVIH